MFGWYFEQQLINPQAIATLMFCLLLVLLTIVSGCVSKKDCHNLHDMMHRKYSLSGTSIISRSFMLQK